MKQNVRNAALDCLLQVLNNQAYSNLLLNQMIKKHDLSAKDVGLLTELVYGTIQHYAMLDYTVAPYIAKAKKLEKWVTPLLWMSVYQMHYLTKIPDHAIINEAVTIAKQRGHQGVASLVNGVLRNVQRGGKPNLTGLTDVDRLALETSHPLWLVERWVEQFGFEEAEKMCRANNEPPKQTLRINRLKGTREEVIARLATEGIEAQESELHDEALVVERGNAATTDAFRDGLFSVQDESSMLVAKCLGAKQGTTVLDACSAPGGKTMHIGETMNGEGEIVALDLHPHKVKLVAEQAKRLHLSLVKPVALDARQLQEKYEAETFDYILVDAPCSGHGVMRRKPDMKLTKEQGDVERLQTIQLAILRAVAPLLKQGGTLVYSTCTTDRVENEEVVAAFLQQHEAFSLDESVAERIPAAFRPYCEQGQVRLLPHQLGTDGFYIATMTKEV